MSKPRIPPATKAAREPAPPALIDTPAPFQSLAAWVAWRAELDTLDVPHLGPYKREADEMTERLRRDGR